MGDILKRSPNLVLLNNSPYFTFIVEALHHVFNSLHINHTVVTSIPAGSNWTVILFTTHERTTLPRNYISYNFEQLTTDKPWPPQLFEKFRAARMVWDYSLENVKILAQHGVRNTVHVPLGYTDTMENKEVPSLRKRDVDVMFVGSINSRRASKLLQLAHPTSSCIPVCTPGNPLGPQAKTVFSSNCWGDRLTMLYRQSKVALNLHFYGGRTILEVHRILPLIANRVLVLSEASDDTWLDESLKGVVNFVTSNDVVQPIKNMLQSDIDTEANRRYQELRACCNYLSYFKTALHTTPNLA